MSKEHSDPPAKQLSRRDALALLGSLGSGALLTQWAEQVSAAALPQEVGRPLLVAGKRAELHLTIVSPFTLRISILSVSEDGAAQPIEPTPDLLERNWPQPAAKVSTLARAQTRPQAIPRGSLQKIGRAHV